MEHCIFQGGGWPHPSCWGWQSSISHSQATSLSWCPLPCTVAMPKRREVCITRRTSSRYLGSKMLRASVSPAGGVGTFRYVSRDVPAPMMCDDPALATHGWEPMLCNWHSQSIHAEGAGSRG